LHETTYHKDKIYIPREVKERLRLKDGDRLTIEVTDSDEARIKIVENDRATQELLELLENPPRMGKIKGRLTRREIYEDVA